MNSKRKIVFLVACVILFAALALPLLAQETTMADDNAALFLEALRIQGYIAPETGGKDISSGNEAFLERSTRIPDTVAGDWFFFAPTGEGYYWTTFGRMSTIDNYRVAVGAGLPFGKITAYVREHGHMSVADNFAGYQLVESDHLWLGGGVSEIAGTGLSLSYSTHDVNRSVAVPVLPEYDADHFRLWYQSDYTDGIEWRADLMYDNFTSALFGFKNAQTRGVKVRADYRFDDLWRARADYFTRWQDAATGVENNYSGDNLHFGVKYGGSSCPWFGGADIATFRNRGVPALNTHLDEGHKYDVYFGWKSDSYLQRIQAGYEFGNMDLTRLKLEDPGFQQIKTQPNLMFADLSPFWQMETPDYSKWFFDTAFKFGEATLNGKYTHQTTTGTATGQAVAGGPLQPILPETQDIFRAACYVPLFDRADLNIGEWYRKSTETGGLADLNENVLSADLSFNVFANNTLSVGAERSEWETGSGGLQELPADKLTQDTWRVGWATDFGNADANVSYARTQTNSAVAGLFDDDYSTFTSQVNFKFGKLPVTLGAEVLDGNFAYAPNFDYGGFRVYLRTIWDF